MRIICRGMLSRLLMGDPQWIYSCRCRGAQRCAGEQGSWQANKSHPLIYSALEAGGSCSAHSSARRIAASCNQRVVAVTECGNMFCKRLSAVCECAHGTLSSHSFLAMDPRAEDLVGLRQVPTSWFVLCNTVQSNSVTENYREARIQTGVVF